MSRIKEFLYNHRKKFYTCGFIAGAVFLTTKYAQKAIRDMQERQAKEFIQKTKRMKHYESTERTCNQAIFGLNEALCGRIIELINTNEILEKLRTNSGDKIELWNEMKVLSFTRLATLIYGTTMLTIALRIQLNLLGGYIYKYAPTTVSGTQQVSIVNNVDVEVCNQTKITEEVQQNYLSLIQYFLNDGIVNLSKFIELKIREIMKTCQLGQKFTISDIEHLFWTIQATINNSENNPCNNMIKYIVSEQTIENNNFLQKMLIETLDFLESDDVATLCSNNISSGFSIALDNISEYFTDSGVHKPTNSSNSSGNKNEKSQLNTVLNINKIEMPLAKLIPLINGLTSNGFENSAAAGINKQPNLSTSLVTYYLVSEKIKILGGNVYEVFSV